MNILAQPGQAEVGEVIDSLERLQAALDRFAPLLDRQSGEIITQARLVLKTIGDEIEHLYIPRHAETNQDRLERWDNEGGMVKSSN